MFCDPVYLTNKRALTLVINKKHSLDLPEIKSERLRNLRKNRICDVNSVIRRILLVTEQSQMINDVQQTTSQVTPRVVRCLDPFSSVRAPAGVHGSSGGCSAINISLTVWEERVRRDLLSLSRTRRTLLEQLANNDILYHNS